MALEMMIKTQEPIENQGKSISIGAKLRTPINAKTLENPRILGTVPVNKEPDPEGLPTKPPAEGRALRCRCLRRGCGRGREEGAVAFP